MSVIVTILYLNIYTLLVCLFPINVKMAEPIGQLTQRRSQEFVQGGGLMFIFFLSRGGMQHPTENKLKFIDFTGPGGA